MELKTFFDYIIPILVVIIGYLVAYFSTIGSIKERILKVEIALSERIAKLETKMDVFWKIVEEEIPKIIHSPHTPELDRLLEKMMKEKLSIEDATSLRHMLKEAILESDTSKRLAIVLLMARLDQIISEGETK